MHLIFESASTDLASLARWIGVTVRLSLVGPSRSVHRRVSPHRYNNPFQARGVAIRTVDWRGMRRTEPGEYFKTPGNTFERQDPE